MKKLPAKNNFGVPTSPLASDLVAANTAIRVYGTWLMSHRVLLDSLLC